MCGEVSWYVRGLVLIALLQSKTGTCIEHWFAFLFLLQFPGLKDSRVLCFPGQPGLQIHAKRNKSTMAILVDGLGCPTTYPKGNGFAAAREGPNAGGCVCDFSIDC